MVVYGFAHRIFWVLPPAQNIQGIRTKDVPGLSWRKQSVDFKTSISDVRFALDLWTRVQKKYPLVN
jgi:hypothetical protein